MVKTSIIVLNYNAGEFLEKCINSVTNSKNSDFEIIVVDNGSTDGSYQKCKKKFLHIKLIENRKNLGYVKGNNIDIKHAQGDFVVNLNPDTEVDQNWLIQFHKAYDKFLC